MIEMNREGKIKGTENEVLYLQEVSFLFLTRKWKFVKVWLEDVADLGDSDDETRLTFPEGF